MCAVLNADLSSNSTNFRTAGSHTGDVLRVSIEGEASLDELETLGRVLDATHAEAQRLAAKEVVMDLTQLEFLNSSGVKHFVTWLQKASSIDDGYKIRLVSSPLVPWQRRGLEVLRCFAPQRVTVEAAAATL